MTPQQLKNSILQRAIEGRLVEQRPEEGTAQDLLKEIQAEKAQLVKEGKIKKTKALPPITEEEKPFDIPDGWEWVRFSEVLEIQTNLVPPSEYADYPQVAPDIIEKGTGKLTGYRTVRENKTNSNNQHFYKGQILYSKIRPALKKAVIAPYEGLCSADMYPLRSYMNTKYALWVILSETFTEQVKQKANRVKMPKINMDELSSIVIALPPLAEQHRIVAKIEELLPLIDKYDKAYTKLTDFNTRFPEAMKKSLLQYAIQGKLVEQRTEEGTAQDLIKEIQAEKKRLIDEKKIKKLKALPPITDDEIPFDIPESWDWVRLGEIGDWGSGATPKRHHPEYYGGDIPWLKTGDLNDGYVSEIPETITQEGFDNSSVRLNPVGSVLIAMYGATIGKLGILTRPATTNQACCACVPFANLNSKYLFYYLMSQRTNFIKLGEGGAQPNISKEKIVNFLFPIPPLAEQHRIVAKLEELLPFCDQPIK